MSLVVCVTAAAALSSSTDAFVAQVTSPARLMCCYVVGCHAVCLQARHSRDPKIPLVGPRILKFDVLVQSNALLGPLSNVVRTTQRGPRMLLGTDGLRSARAMPLLQQAVDPNLRPTHTVVKMADDTVTGGKKGFTLDVQLIIIHMRVVSFIR